MGERSPDSRREADYGETPEGRPTKVIQGLV